MSEVEEFREWARTMAARAQQREAKYEDQEIALRSATMDGCGAELIGGTQRAAIWTRPSVKAVYFGLRLYCDSCFSRIMEGGGPDYSINWMPKSMVCGDWTDLNRRDVFVRGERPPEVIDQAGDKLPVPAS